MSLILLVGGARSGKSAIAVDLLRGSSRSVTFVATAEERDDEMRQRIARHRRERPKDWQTVEAPRSLFDALVSVPNDGAIIVDCLTLWIANLVEANFDDDAVLAETTEIASFLKARQDPGIVISNEVGSGLVPMEELSRRYRDLLGRVNACIGASADLAYYVVAGRVLSLAPARSILDPST